MTRFRHLLLQALLLAPADTDAGGGAAPTTPPAGEATPPKTPPAEKEGSPATPPEKKEGEPAPAPKDGEPTKKEGEAAPAAELEVKLPDGVAIDATLMEGFKGVAKAAGLSSESATQLATWYAKEQQAATQRNEETWKAQGTKWLEELRADKDFGGANLEANVNVARKAIVRFGGEPLAQELTALGLDNHPTLVRAFFKAGKAIAEDFAGEPPRTDAPKTLTGNDRHLSFYTDMKKG